MDESVIKHLEQPQVGTLKLSEAIRIGKPMVGAEQPSFRLCALGCAWAGVKGHVMSVEEITRLVQAAAEMRDRHYGITILRELGYPQWLGEEISIRHSSGTPALQIADWLQAQGL